MSSEISFVPGEEEEEAEEGLEFRSGHNQRDT